MEAIYGSVSKAGKYSFRDDDRLVLASLTHYFDSGCWRVTDLRLMQHRPLSRYLEPGAESFLSTLKPETPEGAAFLKSQLREFIE